MEISITDYAPEPQPAIRQILERIAPGYEMPRSYEDSLDGITYQKFFRRVKKPGAESVVGSAQTRVD